MSRGKAKATILLEQEVISIVEERHPITVRGIAYPLFVRGFISSMAKKNTNKISGVTKRMREEGTLDWRQIVDDARRVQHLQGWGDPDEAISTMVEGYRRDYWQDQDVIVEVWAEKATVQGVLGPVLREYGLPFRVMKGYASMTAMKEAAEASKRAALAGKYFQVLYMGDYDPSGMQMSEVDIPKRFYGYGGCGDIRRIAITQDDFHCQSFSVYEKTTDTRFEWFLKRFGDECWELDAMNPNDLRERTEEQIRACLDLLKWEKAKEIEAVEVASMREFHDEWQQVMEGAA